MPYVYLVKNKTTQLKYVGVKYQQRCIPELFWITYFTSSNAIKNLIKLYGKDDFIFKIIRVFDNQYDAIKFESQLLEIATKREDYLNMHMGYLVLTEEQFEENTKQQRIRASIQGNLSYKNKTGLFRLTTEERSEISKRSGVIAGIANKKLGRAIFDPEVMKRQHKTLKEKQVSAYYDPKLRAAICLKGGQNGIFSKNYHEKNGLSEEERIEKQRERGRKGGPKNKGFKWYTDDIRSYKYTKSEQLNLSFEDFLKNNPRFRGGRDKNKTRNEGMIWVNDGAKNFYIDPVNFDILIHIKGKIKSEDKKNNEE